MFIKIDSKNIFFSQGNDSLIELIQESYYLNISSLIQIQFEECLLKKQFLNELIKFEYLIKLYVLADEGIWNFMILYFTKDSKCEFQKIKKLIDSMQ